MATAWKKCLLSGRVEAGDLATTGLSEGAMLRTNGNGVLEWSNEYKNFYIHNTGRYIIKHSLWNWCTNGTNLSASSSQMADSDIPFMPKIEAEDVPLSIYAHPDGAPDLFLNKIRLMWGTNSLLAGTDNHFHMHLFRANSVTDEQTGDVTLVPLLIHTEQMTSTDDFKLFYNDFTLPTTIMKTFGGGDTMFMACRHEKDAGSGQSNFNISLSLQFCSFEV